MNMIKLYISLIISVLAISCSKSDESKTSTKTKPKANADSLVLEPKQLDFENSNKVSVNECWEFNSYANIFTIVKAVLKEKPDAVLFNLQFVKFGDKKIPAALGLLLPMILKMLGCNTVVFPGV